jgi:hypothetical protein
MEIVALRRPAQGTFLCAGTAPAIGRDPVLVDTTHRIGTGLRAQYGYRGAFSADGINTIHGFLPTDFNARLTSSIEPTPPEIRARLHAANLLIREGRALRTDAVDAMVTDGFDQPDQYTIYAATTQAVDDAPRRLNIRWQESRLVATDDRADGQLTLVQSQRGWQLTVYLQVDRLPSADSLGSLAPEVFRFCDRALGTDFGLVTPASGLSVARSPG